MNKKDINLLRPRRIHGWQEFQPDEPEIEIKPKKRSFLFYFIPGLIIILIFGSFTFAKKQTFGQWSNNPGDYNQLTLQPKKLSIFGAIKSMIFGADANLKGQKDDRINVLLLGIGGANHDGGYLSDTNIILSVKPSTNEVALISVPRDMSAKVEGYGWVKINHANAYGEMKKKGGGGELARKTFENTLGIKIPYYATVDFTAFKEIVDTVGGIEIDVPRSFVDYSYPGPNYSYQTVYFKKGKEKMVGSRALIYARSRKGNNGEGSDFARARRQQLVIAALKNNLLSAGTYLNPVKIKKIIDSLSTHISTNLDFGQIMYLAGIAREVDDTKIKTLVLDNSANGYLRSIIGYDGAYLLAPKSGNFKQIETAVKNVFGSTTTTPVYTFAATEQTENLFPSAHIEIQNATWRVGLAAKTKRDLEDKGFAIFTIGNSELRPINSSTLFILDKNIQKGFVDAMERETKLKATTTLPDWFVSVSSTTNTATNTIIKTAADKIKYDSRTDVLLILGEDYGKTTINTANTSTTNTL